MRAYVIAMGLAVTSVSVAASKFADWSKGSGIPEPVLAQYCKKITCTYDKLKDRVQATASDAGGMPLAYGGESRGIEFTWVSSLDSITITLFDVINPRIDSWHQVSRAEIYIGKEVLIDLTGSVDRRIGYYNDASRSHERIETISTQITIDQARQIATADPESVTIRFYGASGYADKEKLRKHHLLNVVELASSVQPAP